MKTTTIRRGLRAALAAAALASAVPAGAQAEVYTFGADVAYKPDLVVSSVVTPRLGSGYIEVKNQGNATAGKFLTQIARSENTTSYYWTESLAPGRTVRIYDAQIAPGMCPSIRVDVLNGVAESNETNNERWSCR